MKTAMDTKVILITGSSRGLGAHAAYSFASKGYGVIVNYSRSEEEAERLVRKIKTEFNGSRVLSVQADVSRRDEVNAMFDRVYEQFGTCDVLINMAGINKDAPFVNMNNDEWNSVIQTILTGTFNCCQEFAHRYRGTGGQIINIGAVTGITGRKNGVNYCSARAGVLNLTRCLALELAPAISVNTMTPGCINTDEVMTRHSLHIRENHERKAASIPAGRLGTPEDVFNALDFIVSGSTYMTGQNIIIDGGLLMR